MFLNACDPEGGRIYAISPLEVFTGTSQGREDVLEKVVDGVLMHVWMVPEDTIHNGTSKCHQMDEKSPILRCTFLRQYSDFFNHPTTPITHSKIQWSVYILIPNCDVETCSTILSVLGGG